MKEDERFFTNASRMYDFIGFVCFFDVSSWNDCNVLEADIAMFVDIRWSLLFGTIMASEDDKGKCRSNPRKVEFILAVCECTA